MQDHPLTAVQRLVEGLGLQPADLPAVKAALLHILYGVRSDAALADHLANNIRFQAFVAEDWDEAAYSAARERVLLGAAEAPLALALRALEAAAGLMDRAPFTPDRELIADWAPPGALGFDDLATLTDRQVQQVLKHVQTHELACALKDAPPAVRAKIDANVSTRMRSMIADDVLYMAHARPGDIQEVRGKIGRQMRKLAARGLLDG